MVQRQQTDEVILQRWLSVAMNERHAPVTDRLPEELARLLGVPER